MKLVQVKLRNFRCYREETSVDFADMTVFVGRNDSGKSTVLDALNIFFSDSLPDKNDASRGGNASDVRVTCVFDDLPAALVLDQAEPTSLQSEFLLNPDGRLEITKVFNGALEKPKLSRLFLRVIHPTVDGASDLVKLNNSELKTRAQDLGADMTGVDKKINCQLRQAIRSTFTDLAMQEIELALLEGTATHNGQNFWKGIQSAMPAFALFHSDRPSTDQDPEAQDPLNAAIKEAVKQKEGELDAIAQHIQDEVKKIADLTLQKLREMDPTLATTLSPQFPAPKWATLFKASITGDNDIPINKRGSGVRRLVLLNFFRAKAERLCREERKSNAIYAIEEPETSQHPRNQRLLLAALRDLTGTDQVIVTTHTPMLARCVPAAWLRFVEKGPGGIPQIVAGGSEETNRRIVDSLGVLPDHTVKLFIGVEGKFDIPFLRNLSKLLVDSGVDVPDLEKLELDGHVIFTPFGGSGLALWTDRLAKLNRPEFHVYDRDIDTPPKYQPCVDDVNARGNCKALLTKKREMENYVHWRAINTALAERGIAEAFAGPLGDTDDVPRLLVDLVNPGRPQGDKWGMTRAKDIICSVATTKMTKTMLDEVDPDREIEGWFASMKVLLALTD